MSNNDSGTATITPVLDPFQTPINVKSGLPEVGPERTTDDHERVIGVATGPSRSASPSRSREVLGDPIALETRPTARRHPKPLLATSSSSSSSSASSSLGGFARPSKKHKNPSDLFFYPQPSLSTITPRPSPPARTHKTFKDNDDRNDEDDDDEDDDHDQLDSDPRNLGDLGVDIRSTPWGPGALTSDTGHSHGSPADMELRTPGLDSSVFPVRRLGIRKGFGRGAGRDEDEDEDEDEAEEGDEGGKRSGKEGWKMMQSRGLETPAPAPLNRQPKDLSSVFPFALSTPQNPSTTTRRSPEREVDRPLETPLQPQSKSQAQALSMSEPPRERKRRESVTLLLPPLTALSTPITAKRSASTFDPTSMSTSARATPEVGSTSASMSMSTGKKRRRTSPEELMVLEEAYVRNQLPTSDERARLAGQTGMSTRAVQIWFQNKRQTEKRKANQKVFPTMMLVPLRHGSASEPSSEAQTLVDETPRPFLLPVSGKRAGASKSPTGHAYHYVPAGEGQVSAVSKGKRPVLPGDQEEDTFFTSKPATRADKADERDDEDERDLGADTEVDELDQGDHEVHELDDDDEGIARGRSREAVLPTSDVRSSSPALIRSSSPVVLLKERQQLKRRGSSAEDKKDGKKEQDAKRERLMLFPSSSSIEVELSEDVVAPTPTQGSARSDRASPATVMSTPKNQESSRSAAIKRTTSERMPGSLKRQIIGIADISAGDQTDASPLAPFSGRKFVVSQSVPSFSIGARRDGLFAKPVSPLGKRKFSSRFNIGFPIRSDLPTPGKSFGRSQSGILDEMCSRKELPFLPSSARKEVPGTPCRVASSEPEDHVKVESEIMLSQSKTAMAGDTSLLDLLPSDPPSMGLIDFNSDAEDAPFEGDTDVEETPKKKMKTQDVAHGPGLRQFASLDYFAGSPSKRKGLLGDESRRLSGLGTARRRLFEAHLQQQAQQRASVKAKKQTSSSKKKKKTPASSLKRSGSSSSASIALATIAATPTRKPLASSHSMPDLALVTSDKVNITPDRRVRGATKDGKAEQQTDEEAARLLLGLFGGRS